MPTWKDWGPYDNPALPDDSKGYVSVSVAPTIVGTAITVTDINAPSRKLNVRFADVSRFNWDAPNHGFSVNIETNLVKADTLLDYRLPPLIAMPRRKNKKLLAPPKLVVDEVTRYLSWEHITYEQKAIDETEARMTGIEIWGSETWRERYSAMGIDLGKPGGDRTVFHNSWGKAWGEMADAVGIPAEYLGHFPQEPPEPKPPPFHHLKPMQPPRGQPIVINEPIAVYNKSAVLRAMELLSEKKKEA